MSRECAYVCKSPGNAIMSSLSFIPEIVVMVTVAEIQCNMRPPLGVFSNSSSASLYSGQSCFQRDENGSILAFPIACLTESKLAK